MTELGEGDWLKFLMTALIDDANRYHSNGEIFRLGRVACPRLKISVIQTPRGQLPFVLFRVFVDCKLLNSEAGTPLMCGIMQSLKARGILSEFGNQR